MDERNWKAEDSQKLSERIMSAYGGKENANKPFILSHGLDAKPLELAKNRDARLEDDDITRLKEEAKNQGLPYQSLIGSILHKYLNGTLVDIGEAKKVLNFQVK